MKRALLMIRHTLRLLGQNIGVALRISIPWAVLTFAAVIVAAILASMAQSGAAPGIALLSFAAFAGAFVVMLFGFGAAATAWHRYILLNEMPTGFLPRPPSGVVWPYIGRAFVISLILMAVAIPAVMLLFSILGSIASSVAIMLGALFALNVLVQFIFMRLAISLPAVALGNRAFSISDAWRQSSPEKATIFWVVLIMTVVAGVVQALTGYGEAGGDPATMEQPGILIVVLQLALSWLYVMFGICILTTFYGVIVEGRDI
jgi:hypothetical protein